MPATQIESLSPLKPGLTVLCARTPNAVKLPLYLETLGLDYNVLKIDMAKGEHKSDWYLKLNPRGSVPTLLVADEGGNLVHSIFESAAALQYIADTYDKENKHHYPIGDPLHYDELCWMYFQLSSLSSKEGEAFYYRVLAPEKIPEVEKRFGADSEGLFQILEHQLQKTGTGYLVGNKLSLADIISWPWINFRGAAGVTLDGCPLLQLWYDKLAASEAFKTAVNVPN